MRASHEGSHQFHRPKAVTRAGTRSARTIVASIRMPTPRAVPSTLMSVPGEDASAAKAKNRISAAGLTSYGLLAAGGETEGPGAPGEGAGGAKAKNRISAAGLTSYGLLAAGGDTEGPSVLAETLLGAAGALMVLIFVFPRARSGAERATSASSCAGQ